MKNLQSKNEMLLNAGLNWSVESRPLYDNEGREVSGYKAITRTDNGRIFCVSSSRYVPIQNEEVASVAESLCGTGGAFFHKARAFKDGARVTFALAVPDANFTIGASDKIETFLLCTASHDGSAAVSIMPFARRLVCQNGMTRVIADVARRISVRHVKSGADRLRIDASRVLSEEIRRFAGFREKARELAAREFSALEFETFLDGLFDRKKEEETIHGLNRRKELEFLFYHGTGNEGKTAWDAFNAVTEYNQQRGRLNLEAREYSTIYGAGAELEERAAELLIVR